MGTVENTLPVEQDLRAKAPALAFNKPVRSLGGETSEGRIRNSLHHGADITQTFTFWCHEDSLPKGCKFSCDEINQAACDIAKKVSKSRGTIVAGGITQTGIFDKTKADKNKIQGELRSALEILVKNKIDLIICEVCAIDCFQMLKLLYLSVFPKYLGDGVGNRS